VQLVEGIDAALEVGEEREPAFSITLLRDRAQQFRDAGVSADVVLRLQVVEDLRLEIRKTQAGESYSAGTARTEHDVPLREPGPFAEEPCRLDRGGKLLCSHARGYTQ